MRLVLIADCTGHDGDMTAVAGWDVVYEADYAELPALHAGPGADAAVPIAPAAVELFDGSLFERDPSLCPMFTRCSPRPC